MYNVMKRDDLKTGDIVLSSKGSYGIVLRDTAAHGSFIKWFKNNKGEVIHKYRMLCGSVFDDTNYVLNNLEFADGSGKIVKVYRPTDPHVFSTMEAINEDYVIYDKTKKKMTVAEVEAALGHEVEIVAD